MVVDEGRNLHLYFPLDEALKSISKAEVLPIPEFHSFQINRSHTVIFTVEKGSVTAATSWRENPDSREVTGAVSLESGMFAIYLPGEPFLVKCDTEDTEAVMRIVGGSDEREST